MVGTSLEHDVRGALAAGLDAVWPDRDGANSGSDVQRMNGLDELFPD